MGPYRSYILLFCGKKTNLIVGVTTIFKKQFFGLLVFSSYFKFSGLYLNYSLAASFVRCRLMSGYKDRENEGLGPRRARFQTVRKQDKKAEVSFGTRGGRGCNCRVRRIVVRC